MEIKENRHIGEEFERYLSLLQSDPKRSRQEGRESGVLCALKLAIRKGCIDFSNLYRVFDFGSGYGGPTNALKYFLPDKAILEAAEINPAKAAELVHFGIIAQGKIYKDGFRYLEEQKEAGVQIDLVSAFMFGPEQEDLLFGKFVKAVAPVLSSDGQIILTSDGYTFRTIMQYCRNKRIGFKVNEGALTATTMSCIPSTLHIKSSALLRYQNDK